MREVRAGFRRPTCIWFSPRAPPLTASVVARRRRKVNTSRSRPPTCATSVPAGWHRIGDTQYPHSLDTRTANVPLAHEHTGDTLTETTHSELGELRFLTVGEIAAVLRVSKMTVYRLIKSGDLPSARIGKAYRVREDAVLAYLRMTGR